MREAVLVAAVRSAIGKAPRGGLSQTRPDDLAALVLQALLARVPALDASEIDDVLLGCAVPEAEQGMNLARVVALRAGLPVTVPGVTINRFCASGLQTLAWAAQQVMTGMADVVVAGGVESMSLLPMGGYNLSPNPHLMHELPQTYLSMGLTAEQVARQWQVSREDQDAFALRSHQRAAAAWDSGRFQAEVVPVRTRRVQVDAQGRPCVEEVEFAVDEGVRRDTSLAALAQLKPAFAVSGTVTAGNSSQTSDGAAWVLVMAADRARALGLRPLAVFRSFAVAGVDPGVMGIGPLAAVPKALHLAGLTLSDMDLIELNEAFAAQALAVMRALEMDEDKVNVNGGAIALGHPLGCTGARMVVTLLHELHRRGGRYGLVAMCVGGGMGAAAVLEALPGKGE